MTWADAFIARDLHGQTVVITGANSGLGFESALVAAQQGAHVVMACRSEKRAQDARDRIHDAVPTAQLEIRALDTSDLHSVRAFASGLRADHPEIHALINNAGIMAIPHRTSVDGFELQLATNHLGHFVLTAQLLPALLAGQARIIHVASQAHRTGRLVWDNLMGERFYERWTQYGLTKLANLLFHYELTRRIAQSNAPIRSIAAHPGYADTNLSFVGPSMDKNGFMEAIMRIGGLLIAQSAQAGALPQNRALLDPGAQNGDYFGPHWPGQTRGKPVRVKPARHALRAEDQQRFWAWSEEITGEVWPTLP